MNDASDITVVLADDEHLLRAAMAALLPMNGSITIVAEAEDGATAVQATLTHHPDVLVIDLEMPGMDGLEAATEIVQELPDQTILMVTRHARPGVLRRALKLGVRGFMSKSDDPEDIVGVIHELHAGRRWISHEVLQASVVDDCPLTERESDVLRETRSGFSVREIARRLHLAPGTVRNYLSTAMQKTGSPNRHHAARAAQARGWL